MLGPAFQQTQIYLVIGVLIEVFRILANAAGLRFHQNNQTRRLIWPALAAFLVLLALNLAIKSSLISIVVSMALSAVLLLVMMMDKMLLRQVFAVCRQGFSIPKTLIFVVACTVLFSSQQYLQIESHAIVWISVWAIIGFFYLRSVLTQVSRA